MNELTQRPINSRPAVARQKKFLVRDLMAVVAVSAVVCGLIATIRSLRLHDDRMGLQGACYSSLNHIAGAMLDYSEEHGRFPRPFEADGYGKIVHSWRPTLLRWYPVHYPQADLYDFGQRWDTQGNSKLSAQVPAFMQCPSRGPENPGGSPFVMINDFGTTPIDQIPAAAILVIEAWDANRNWLDPRDPVAVSGEIRIHPTDHPHGTGVILRDFSVQRIRDVARIKKRGKYYVLED